MMGTHNAKEMNPCRAKEKDPIQLATHIITPRSRPSYGLGDLLSMFDISSTMSADGWYLLT